MDWERIVLTEDQKDLLCEMVEAARSVQKKERRKFMHSKPTSTSSGSLLHDGLPDEGIAVYEGDLAELQSKGLLHVTFGGKGTPNYMLTAEAYEYYEHLKAEEEEQVGAVEEDVRRFLEAGRLASRHPEAHRKWKAAADILWSTEAEESLTKIGHDCWKAMQFFATDLVEEHEPEGVDDDPEKTINRVAAVLQKQQEEGGIGKTRRRYLDGLLQYWKRLTPLVQRQRHDGEKATWEEGRAVVFGTGFAMYEIDRAVR